MKFVNTVIDSVADIVRGNVSGVVNKINDVLGQMVPIIIGFLASVIGLGGIGQKIREIIQKLQKPVNKALDFVIKTGLKLAGPIIRGIKGISGKVKAKVAAGKAWVKGKVEAGKEWAKGKVAGAKEKVGLGAKKESVGQPKPVETPVNMNGAPHKLTATFDKGQVRVTLASPSARELLGCVTNEIRTQENLAAPLTGEEKAYHEGAANALKAFRSDYDAAAARIRGGPPADIEAQLRVLNTTIAGKVAAIAARYKLKDFVLQAWNVAEHFASIREQVREHLEKHLGEATSVGGGHNNSATAAELALGWVHQSDRRHVEKTSTAMATMGTADDGSRRSAEARCRGSDRRAVVRRRQAVAQGLRTGAQ